MAGALLRRKKSIGFFFKEKAPTAVHFLICFSFFFSPTLSTETAGSETDRTGQMIKAAAAGGSGGGSAATDASTTSAGNEPAGRPPLRRPFYFLTSFFDSSFGAQNSVITQ